MKSKILNLVFLLFWVFLLSRCVGTGPLGGGNPAGPPTPLAELPSLQFPENISDEFDVSSPAGSGTSGASLSASGFAKFALMPGDNIAADIRDSAFIFRDFSSLVDEILAPLNQLEIPRSVDVTNFEDLIVLQEDLVNVKIDFSNYGGESCSGNTAELPVCYRIWFNDKRVLAGVFLKAFPTDDNQGAGRFTGISPSRYLTLIPFVTSVDYDVVDPLAKQAEYYVAFPRLSEENPEIDDIPMDKSELLVSAHIFIQQTGPIQSALRIIFSSLESFMEETQTFKNISQWLEDDNFWSGSQETSDTGDEDFLGACALLSTGLVVETQNCIDRNIDVTGLEFIDFLEISDLAFPPDFPPSPTF